MIFMSGGAQKYNMSDIYLFKCIVEQINIVEFRKFLDLNYFCLPNFSFLK